MARYRYCGPVKEFDNIVNNKWEASTEAPSEKKARSNLIFRYKRDHGRAVNSKITLPGKITLIG